jgi:hypothetical protein
LQVPCLQLEVPIISSKDLPVGAAEESNRQASKTEKTLFFGPYKLAGHTGF